MFGYVVVNKPELKIREYDTYRSYYCGLCRTLKKRDGLISQMLLNYDMTFLALLLTGLYEPEEEIRNARCAPHPVRKHAEVFSEVMDYCADMTVLLAYEKAKDDWHDEKKASGRALSGVLKTRVEKIRSQYPRQAAALSRSLKELSAAERAGSDNLDEAAGACGRFLGEIFVWKEDEWARQMHAVGFYLGKFIYLLDAFDDLEKDAAKNNYNVLLKQGSILEQPGALEEILSDTMSRCAAAFERLPVIKGAPIIRNILYAGVWVRYNAVKAKRKKTDK